MRDINHDLCAACTSVSSVGRLNGADEFKRTRKGRRPAPTPLNETRFPPYEPIYPIGPAPRRGRARRADGPGKKEGPAVSGALTIIRKPFQRATPYFENFSAGFQVGMGA